MSKELNQLRSQGLKPRATSTTSTDDSSFSADMAGNSSSTIPADNFDLPAETVGIGCVVISAAIAVDAFKIFASLFHPKLPVLVSVNISTIYSSSPVLFWTIIAIVASHTTVPSADGLFDEIAEPFQDMIRTAVLQAPLPLQTIRALLLLCVWPMPVETQRQDPSWLYSGIAVNSALYLGLHRPGPSPPSRGTSDYLETPLERIATWLGCFYVSGFLSMHLGLPVTIGGASELARVATCLQEYPISREFAAEVKLQAIIADFTNIFSHTSNDGAIDSSILHLLDRDLEGLRSAYPDQWPRLLEYNTLVAKLHMYGLVITKDRVGSTARETLLKLSFSISLRIIYLANVRHNENLPETYGLSSKCQQGALPKAYFKGLAFTTAFLLRYFSLNAMASVEEQQLAANHVVLSHSIFKSYSSRPTDEMGRVATIFEELCQHGPMTIESQQVAPGGRGGVAILMRTMRSAQQKYNTTSNMEPLVPPTEQSVPTYSNLISMDPFGVSMNQTLGPWDMDMICSDQYWNEPMLDALNLPFMDPQFQPRQTD
ncbi:hypothetical protein GGR51DRAFT_547350 [Nemania sp. FL0031]|nr:hypothetical protein GGR51DRAFT_547350 [Nemania sp. FL0031]